MSKMKVQDATKELSKRAAKLLGDVTGVRTAAEKTLAELRKIESGFMQQEEAQKEEKRREEQQKALKAQSKAWTMPDDTPEPAEAQEAAKPAAPAAPEQESKPQAAAAPAAAQPARPAAITNPAASLVSRGVAEKSSSIPARTVAAVPPMRRRGRAST